MNFIDWCDDILKNLVEVRSVSPKARAIGVSEFELAEALSKSLEIKNFRLRPDYFQTTYYKAMFQAIASLKQINCIENDKHSGSHWKISKIGREHTTNPIPLWSSICQESLETEHKQLLALINRLSPQTTLDNAWLEEIQHETLLTELGWPTQLLWNVARELEQEHFISGFFSLANTVRLMATYKGLVWENQRGFTLESQFIDDLVKDWETTSVEFKQYLFVKSVEQKAEFIKDVLSLANTQASGRRWLIIGFDNKTHEYFGLPNTNLRSDDLERLIAEYTDPCVELRYEVVNYRQGSVGKLEVLRDPKKVPHQVAKPLGDKLKGDKKQIFQGQIFVRHGSQVQEPTDLELQALQEEGNRARSS